MKNDVYIEFYRIPYTKRIGQYLKNIMVLECRIRVNCGINNNDFGKNWYYLIYLGINTCAIIHFNSSTF